MNIFLTDDDVKMIAEESDIDEDVVKSWYKDFIKMCPNGKMDKKHFGKFYKLLRGQFNDENLSKITDHVFRSFDKDSNGYLDFTEFIIAYSSTSKSDPKKKLEFVFLFYDRDKDGIISSKEFLRGVELMYEFRGQSKKEYSPQQCVNDIFKKIDKNGDCKLSKEEFVDACLSNSQINFLLSPYEI